MPFEDFYRKILLQFYNTGIVPSQQQVAKMYNVSQSVISRAWHRFQQSVSIFSMVQVANELPTEEKTSDLCISASRIRADTGVHVSESTTIRRRMHEAGLHARRRARHPFLNREHRVDRRTWALDHRHWTAADWRNCPFTDESRFALYHTDRRILTWCERGLRYHEQHMTPTVAFGGSSLTLWVGFFLLSS